MGIPYLDLYKKILDMETNNLYEFANSKKNNYNKAKNSRYMRFEILEYIKKKPPEHEINAYACYREHEDKIIITLRLVDLVHCIFKDTALERNRDIMRQISLYFCLYHEFSHLYFGHCQISSTKSLSMSYNTDMGFSVLDYQTIEMDADAGAACRTVERILGWLNEKNYEGSKDDFLQDCINAIQGFFFVVRYLESGTKELWINSHPPGIARLCWVFEAMRFHASEMFDVDIDLGKYVKNFYANDLIFSKVLRFDMSGYDYTLLFDNSLIEYKEILEKNWKENIKNKLRGTNRLPLAFK